MHKPFTFICALALCLPAGTARGEPVTTFRLIQAPEHQAVFENPRHDFPQRVIYRLRDSKHLDAWVERCNAGDAGAVADLYTEDGYYASAHILAHGREQE